MMQAATSRHAAVTLEPPMVSKPRVKVSATRCSAGSTLQESSCRSQDKRSQPTHDNEGSLAKAKCWCGKSRKKPWCDGSHAKKVMNITESTSAGTAYSFLE
ncbi:hypothetical protein ABBQ38_001605 [Trebouxia sp. C0009 RCD-2024]